MESKEAMKAMKSAGIMRSLVFIVKKRLLEPMPLKAANHALDLLNEYHGVKMAL